MALFLRPLSEADMRKLLLALYRLSHGDVEATFGFDEVAEESGLPIDKLDLVTKKAKDESLIFTKLRVCGSKVIGLTVIGFTLLWEWQKPWYLRTWKNTLAVMVAGGLLGLMFTILAKLLTEWIGR